MFHTLATVIVTVQFDDYNSDKPSPYDPWKAYGQSKTANVYLANEIQTVQLAWPARHLAPSRFHSVRSAGPFRRICGIHVGGTGNQGT